MKNKSAAAAIIVSLTVLVDQLTKQLVMRHMRLYDSVTVVPGFFNLTYVRNKGAAFGILAGAQGAWRTAFFVVISLVAVAALVFLIRKTGERLSVLAYALICGGALGNLLDRIRLGEVVDFIDWHYRAHHWPAFNVADSAITVGVGLLLIEMLFMQKQEERKTVHSD